MEIGTMTADVIGFTVHRIAVIAAHVCCTPANGKMRNVNSNPLAFELFAGARLALRSRHAAHLSFN
jgi:hypothetical protein